MILVTHPTGNVFVRALLRGLSESGRDFEFHTTLGYGRDEILRQPARWIPELSRRAYDLPAARMRRSPARELARLAAYRLRCSSFVRHESGPFSIDAVYRSLDRTVSRRLPKMQVSHVYAYEDGAYETFVRAHELGIKRCYELPIAYWELGRRLCREEAERLPAWAPTLAGAADSPEKLERKTRELELADLVICPSRFVSDSLPAAVRATKECLISPFGSPCSVPPEIKQPRAKLRVLFAGSMTQRKGLADVFAAMKLLRRADIELVVMGNPVGPMSFYRQEYADFTYERPRAHAAVLQLMRTCDVLVLPSLIEGRALVQQEALSCGLPIIVTAHAGGEDLVEEGRTGFLVPIRAPEKIAERLAYLADHRDLLPGMAEAAVAAAARYRWEDYATRILAAMDLGHE